MLEQIDATQAYANYKQPLASWPTARRRIRAGEVWAQSEPSFSLRTSDTILTMGSCFARNIEEYLARFGCKLPSVAFAVPAHERKGPRPNHVLSLYTPPTFLQEIAWAEEIYRRDGTVRDNDCERFAYRFENGKVLDLHLAGSTPVSAERFLERRRELYALYATAFAADCVVMTPGLAEAWFDKKNDGYTNAAPMHEGKLLDTDRFVLRVLDYTECTESLLKTIDLIRKHNPVVKILITVSPVPLRYTFTDRDIVTANTYSKSVLRAACETIARSRPLIDYFPSFESVMLSSRRVWQKDARHVTDRFVGKIVARLVQKYFPELGMTETFDLDAVQYSLTDRILNFLRKPFSAVRRAANADATSKRF